MTNSTVVHAGVRRWSVDASHSEVGFSVRHLMISKVRGRFRTFSAAAQFDPERLEAGSVQVEIDVSSIDTRDEQRDAHLLSADFFDTEFHPSMTFVSTEIVPRGGSSYDIHGDLTIRGVTRPVTLRAEFTEAVPDPFGGVRIGVSASATINREEFGLTWNQALETGGVLVGENVEVHIDAQLAASD
jgi:polyisoprenoid-binding protein YceI